MSEQNRFHGIIRPLPDESLRSWLNRGLQSRKSILFEHATSIVENTDYDLTTNNVLGVNLIAISEAVGIAPGTLYNYFHTPGAWLKVSKGKETWYCECCLLEDYRKGIPMYHRKAWAYHWYNVCERHYAVLTSMGSEDLTLCLTRTIKSNANFGMRFYFRNFEYSNIPHLSIHRQQSAQTFMPMAVLFQRWCCSLYSSGAVVIGNNKLACSTLQVERVLSDLLSIICRERFPSYDHVSIVQVITERKANTRLNRQFDPGLNAEDMLCRDISVLTSMERMAAFSILALLLKINPAERIWAYIGEHRARQIRFLGKSVSTVWRSSITSMIFDYYKIFINFYGEWPLSMQNALNYLLARPDADYIFNGQEWFDELACLNRINGAVNK